MVATRSATPKKLTTSEAATEEKKKQSAVKPKSTTPKRSKSPPKERTKPIEKKATTRKTKKPLKNNTDDDIVQAQSPKQTPPKNTPLTLRKFLTPSPNDTEIYTAWAPSFFGFYAYLGFILSLSKANVLPVPLQQQTRAKHSTTNQMKLMGSCGSSAGAIAAAIMSLSPNIDLTQLCAKVASLRFRDIADFYPPPFMFRFGLLRGNTFSEILDEFSPKAQLETLTSPVSIPTFDLLRMKTNVIVKGSLAHACRASAGFPVLFAPVLWKDEKIVWSDDESDKLDELIVSSIYFPFFLCASATFCYKFVEEMVFRFLTFVLILVLGKLFQILYEEHLCNFSLLIDGGVGDIFGTFGLSTLFDYQKDKQGGEDENRKVLHVISTSGLVTSLFALPTPKSLKCTSLVSVIIFGGEKVGPMHMHNGRLVIDKIDDRLRHIEEEGVAVGNVLDSELELIGEGHWICHIKL